MNRSIEILHQDQQINWPDFKAGDTICVYLKIQEKNKERIQQFQGVVIQRRGQTIADKTFTVRKISGGFAVERIFPVCLPSIQKIELVREGLVRRAKLFYLRGKKGKAAKIKHREGRKRSVDTKASLTKDQAEVYTDKAPKGTTT